MEMEYKKIKGAVRLYCNEDPAIQMGGSLKGERRKWDGSPWLKKHLCSQTSLVYSLILSIPIQSRGNCESVK